MKKTGNKGFFLIETLVVTSVVAMAMIMLYSQMATLMDGYDLRLTYNTVDGSYAATEINKYILNDSSKYDEFTAGSSAAINSYGFVAITCNSFTNISYCNDLFTNLSISKVIVTEYNTANIKTKALDETTFSDDLKLFIKNITKVEDAPATDYRLIVAFTDGTFATVILNKGEDKIAPVITGDAVLYIIEGLTYKVRYGLTATDNLHGDISPNIVCTLASGSTYDCNVTDSSGNVSNTFSRTIVIVNKESTFNATGAVQTFTPLISAYYKFELWGAQGGSRSTTLLGGKGAYATGTIYLEAGSTVNIYVGAAGDNTTNTAKFNGGAAGGGTGSSKGSSGGGATDIRIGGTALANRILVAAGGGGSNGYTSYNGSGGYGGTTTGGNGTYSTATYNGSGGTQTAGGAKCTVNTTGTPVAGIIGVGGKGGYYSTTYGAGGGGGGYYGGGGACDRRGGAGGGSSFADIATMTSTSLIAGNAVMSNWAGTGTMTGNGTATVTETAGYAKITYQTK